jgi:FAD/FMN-containing dehydrogenase
MSLLRRLRISTVQSIQAEEKFDLIHDGKELDLVDSTLDPNILALCKTLAAELPDCVIFQYDKAAFKNSMDSYWAQQEREMTPACVVQPRNTQQLSAAVQTLKREYDGRQIQVGEGHPGFGLFAIRSGGHSTIPGAASIKGGVMIDLRHFCEVEPSKDETTVVIGTGARWMDVSKTLDKKGLAVVGGRNSAVGVGGLVLGGQAAPLYLTCY